MNTLNYGCCTYISLTASLQHLCLHSKLMATGARQCLSTGHRKQQDCPLWIWPLWTLVVRTRSLVLILGLCASCKSNNRDASKRILRLLNWQLMQSAPLYIQHCGLFWPRGKIFIVPFQPFPRHCRFFPPCTLDECFGEVMKLHLETFFRLSKMFDMHWSLICFAMVQKIQSTVASLDFMGQR